MAANFSKSDVKIGAQEFISEWVEQLAESDELVLDFSQLKDNAKLVAIAYKINALLALAKVRGVKVFICLPSDNEHAVKLQQQFTQLGMSKQVELKVTQQADLSTQDVAPIQVTDTTNRLVLDIVSTPEQQADGSDIAIRINYALSRNQSAIQKQPITQPVIRNINSIREKIANLRQGDSVFVDIDNTLLLTTTKRSIHDTKPQATEAFINDLKLLKERGIKVVALTARTESTAQNTINQLKAIGIGHGEIAEIIYAPESKGLALANYLEQHSSESIKRVLMFDDLQENLDDIAQHVKRSDIELLLYLYHYPQHQALPNTTHQQVFPADLSDYIEIKPLTGGSTHNTFLLRNPTTGDRKVLKLGAHPDAIKLEILTNAMYQAMDVPVPAMQAYNTLPKKMFGKLQQLAEQDSELANNSALKSRFGIFQVNEYVEESTLDDTVKKQLIRNQVQKNFIGHVLAGNSQATNSRSYLVNQDARVLLHDASINFVFDKYVERKEDPNIATEVHSLRYNQQNLQIANTQSSALTDVNDWFADITEEEIRVQLKQIVDKTDLLEQTLWDVSDKLKLDTNERQKYLTQFANRFDQLITNFYPDLITYAKKDRLTDEVQTAAGVFTYMRKDGEIYILLSERDDFKDYHLPVVEPSFGGKSDIGDFSLDETARRETWEESSKQFNYSKYKLSESPFFDYITRRNGKPFVYRMYICEQQHIDIDSLIDREHINHQLVKLSTFLDAIEKGQTIIVNTQESIAITLEEEQKKSVIALFPPSYEILKQPEVKSLLTNLSKEKTIKQITHKQGTPFIASVQQEKRYRPLRSPEIVREDITSKNIKHSALLREFKAQETYGSLQEILKPIAEQAEYKRIKSFEQIHEIPQTNNSFSTYHQVKAEIQQEKLRTEQGVLKKQMERMPSQLTINYSKLSKVTRELYDKLHNILGKQYDQGNLITNIQELLITPVYEKFFWAAKREIVERESLAKELVHILSQFDSKQLPSWVMQAFTNIQRYQDGTYLSPSEMHLKSVLKDKYVSNDPHANIKLMFEFYETMYSQGSILSVHVKEAYTPFIAKLAEQIQREKDNPHLYWFTHGYDNRILFVYHFYQLLYSTLKAKNLLPIFRANNKIFNDFPNIEAVINHYSNNKMKEINNNAVGFSEMILAVNAVLFGSHNIPSSHSISYALHNKIARDASILDLVDVLLSSFDINQQDKEALQSLYAEYYQSMPGGLSQIGVPLQQVPELAYASMSRGVLNPYKNNNLDLIAIIDELREQMYAKGKLSPEDENYLHTLQARLMVPPAHMFESNAVTALGEDVTYPVKSQAKLQQVVNSVVYTMLSNLNEANQKVLVSSPLSVIQQDIAISFGVSSNAEQSGAWLAQAILNNKIQQVADFIADNPKFKKQLIKPPRAAFSDDADGNEGYEIKALRPIELCLLYSKLNDLSTIQTIFGEQWWQDIRAIELVDKDDVPLLIKYIELEKFDVVDYLLKAKASSILINQANAKGFTPFLAAAQVGNISLIENLLNRGVDINQVDYKGRNAIVYLATNENSLNIIKWFIKRGIDISCSAFENYSRPLNAAIEYTNQALIDTLLELNEDVNLADHNGNTALMMAIKCKNNKLITRLFEHKAKINIVNLDGESPLLWAVKYNNPEALDLLLAQEPTILQDGFSPADGKQIIAEKTTSPFMQAIQLKQYDMARVLLKHGNNMSVAYIKECSSLMTLMKEGDASASLLMQELLMHTLTRDIFIKELASEIRNINEDAAKVLAFDSVELLDILIQIHSKFLEKIGVQFLISAFRQGKANLVKKLAYEEIYRKQIFILLAVNKGYVELAKDLISLGYLHSKIFATDTTPLIEAIHHDNYEVVDLLLENDVNLEGLDQFGMTALFYAVKKNDFDLAKRLIKKGANAKHVDYSKRNVLVQFGSDVLDRELVDLLIAHGAEYDSKNYANSPLQFAINNGYSNYFKILMSYGVKLQEIRDEGGFPLITQVIRAKHYKMASLMIDEIANIDVQDKQGRTPLVWLVASANAAAKEALEKLLAKGADKMPLLERVRQDVSYLDYYLSSIIFKFDNEELFDLFFNANNLKIDFEKKQSTGNSLLYDIVAGNKINYLIKLLSAGISMENTMQAAVKKHDLTVLKMLVVHGVNITDIHIQLAKQKYDDNELTDYLLNYVNSTLHGTLQSNNLKSFDQLLVQGSELNIINGLGQTVLDAIASKGKRDFLLSLLDARYFEITLTQLEKAYELALTNKHEASARLLNVFIVAKQQGESTPINIARSLIKQKLDSLPRNVTSNSMFKESLITSNTRTLLIAIAKVLQTLPENATNDEIISAVDEAIERFYQQKFGVQSMPLDYDAKDVLVGEVNLDEISKIPHKQVFTDNAERQAAVHEIMNITAVGKHKRTDDNMVNEILDITYKEPVNSNAIDEVLDITSSNKALSTQQTDSKVQAEINQIQESIADVLQVLDIVLPEQNEEHQTHTMVTIS
ncbi:MAG: hypothetical protein Tsb005_00420 [Gammaproteobacteria bacterium]